MTSRVQLSRKKGWRMPENTVKVSRPGPFGNPFLAKDAEAAGYRDGNAMAVHAYRCWLAGDRDYQPQNRMFPSREYVLGRIPGLRGKNLACWCTLSAPCHADVLLELANAPAPISAEKEGE